MTDRTAVLPAKEQAARGVAARQYVVVTAGYWAFTVTDGAIRMLVVLYFHLLGYSPFEVAMLFLFYELFGVITNLVGGWLGARIGVNLTMHIGMALQILALLMLTVPAPWLSVGYVMAAQALSGIAKDLNKMSAKASVKAVSGEGNDSQLFRWVAILTGSKNALKGVGFFVGALLLELLGFRLGLALLAGALALVLVITAVMLPGAIGKMASKPRFSQMFSRTPAINRLSAARFFLFGARDVWFVVGLPVFLYSVLGWSFMQVGSFIAAWIIGYGAVQAAAPRLLHRRNAGGLLPGAAAQERASPGAGTARRWAFLLSVLPASIALALDYAWSPGLVVTVGLIAFGIVFALNSAVHSYLVLAYSDFDKVAMNVGFYYMANAGGRLVGTVLSGLVYQSYGLQGCLWLSSIFVLIAAWLSCKLPAVTTESAPLV